MRKGGAEGVTSWRGQARRRFWYGFEFKGEIIERPAPSLQEYAPRFESAIVTHRAAKPETVSFYQEKVPRLLSDQVASGTRLDRMDEAVIDGYMQRRTRQLSR